MLNKIANKIKAIGDQHLFIGSTIVTDKDKLSINGNLVYPALIIVFESSTFNDYYSQTNITLILQDKVHELNNKDVLNDTYLTMQDIYSSLLSDSTFNITNNGNVTPYIYDYSDVTSGWELSLSFKGFINSCNIPTK